MQVRENIVEATIGAIVLAVGAAFAWYAYSATDIGRQTRGYALTASFQNASGISTGTDVRVSGLKVGTVTGQALDPDNFQAQVTMTIDDAVQLPTDTTAVVTSEGILGGNYIELKPGFELEFLAPGDQSLYTQGSVDLLSLIGRAVNNIGDKEPAGREKGPESSDGATGE